MSDKEPLLNEEVPVTGQENPAGDAAGAAEPRNRKKSRAGRDTHAEELHQLQEENAALNDKFLRLYSDFENYRKRTTRERLDMLKTASEEVILALLPVLDDFDRALKTLGAAQADDPMLEGVLLIHSKFSNILAQKGLQPIEAMGQVFDTDYHEAITHIPAPSEEMRSKVIDVTEKGYMLGGKVIRYAKVVVGS
ncbi:MAG TPA: nucleotide exchange factor GrpE [Bacteroidales bacterium]|nr:nucleotide exchange factor GrpE [Bacteroidales bacterium]HRZ78036.1 nucleotide exchange factor GrpE [Bacteroidales bacterium]